MNDGAEGDPKNVAKLPIRFKKPVPEDRSVLTAFEVHKGGSCNHLYVPYVVDESEAMVECGRCGEKLNPMWVLGKLATYDRRLAESQARYQDEMKRLRERQRTKCDHCGQMTRISRR